MKNNIKNNKIFLLLPAIFLVSCLSGWACAQSDPKNNDDLKLLWVEMLKQINSPFGYRVYDLERSKEVTKIHDGLDLPLVNKDVYPIEWGPGWSATYYPGNNGGYGNIVVLEKKGGNGRATQVFYYCHLSSSTNEKYKNAQEVKIAVKTSDGKSKFETIGKTFSYENSPTIPFIAKTGDTGTPGSFHLHLAYRESVPHRESLQLVDHRLWNEKSAKTPLLAPQFSGRIKSVPTIVGNPSGSIVTGKNNLVQISPLKFQAKSKDLKKVTFVLEYSEYKGNRNPNPDSSTKTTTFSVESKDANGNPQTLSNIRNDPTTWELIQRVKAGKKIEPESIQIKIPETPPADLWLFSVSAETYGGKTSEIKYFVVSKDKKLSQEEINEIVASLPGHNGGNSFGGSTPGNGSTPGSDTPGDGGSTPSPAKGGNSPTTEPAKQPGLVPTANKGYDVGGRSN